MLPEEQDCFNRILLKEEEKEKEVKEIGRIEEINDTEIEAEGTEGNFNFYLNY